MSVQPFSFDDGDTGDTPTPDDDQFHAQAPVAVSAPAPVPTPAPVKTFASSSSSSSFEAGGSSTNSTSVASSAVEIPAPTPHHAAAPPPPPNFSQQHEAHSPAEVLSRIATFLRQRGIEEFDTYGDGAPALDAFEAEVARLLGFKEAVFFMTGTLAQQIAIELHRADTKSPIVLAHPTSHIVHLTSLDNGLDQAREFAALAKVNLPGADVRAMGALHRALTHQDVADCLGDEKKRWWQALQNEQVAFARALEEHKAKQGMFGSVFGGDTGGPTKPPPLPAPESWRLPGTLLVELPQRMNGGATMPYADLVRTRAAAFAAGLRMHLDGARLWDVIEHYACPLKDVCQHFDSAYVSFYKGVGAMGGAMLLGDAGFCARARAMRHQRGGAAFTMLPIAAHAQMCLRDSLNLFGMRLDACRGMVGLVKSEAARLAYESPDLDCEHLVRFEPRVPQASMVHCYLFAPKSHIERAHAATIAATGARIYNRLRGRGYLADIAAEPVDGSVCAETWYFEWSFGGKNGAIDAELIVEPWRVFLDHLVRLRRAEPPKTVAAVAAVAAAAASAAKPTAATAQQAKATRK